jgi:hypothetical protein
VASAIYGPYRVGYRPITEDAYTIYLYILIIYSISCLKNQIRNSKYLRLIIGISIILLCVHYLMVAHAYFPEGLPIGVNRLGLAIALMAVAVFDAGYVLVFHRKAGVPPEG